MKLTGHDLLRALKFAEKAHEGQMRKFQDVPYIWHPITVAKLVDIYKPDSSNAILLRISALLHDVVEDTKYTLPDIFDQFGPQVASIVDELTNEKDKKGKSKANYLAYKMIGMSNYALVVKLADRLDNVMDLHMVDDPFRSRYIDETEQILHKLLTVRALTETQTKMMRKIRQVLQEVS